MAATMSFHAEKCCHLLSAHATSARHPPAVHCVSKKLCQCYFVNNSVKHWPNLIIFGMQHRKETRHKRR